MLKWKYKIIETRQPRPLSDSERPSTPAISTGMERHKSFVLNCRDLEVVYYYSIT